MGRPLDKRYFGKLNLSACWLPGEGAAATNFHIVKQIGTSRFIVRNDDSQALGTVVLQRTNVTGAGQALMEVWPFGEPRPGSGAAATPIMGLKSGVGASTTLTGGSGYASGDTISFTGSAVVTVDTVGGTGNVTGFHVTTPGQYAMPLPATLAQAATSGAGTGFVLTAKYTIVGFSITKGGAHYDTGATATVSGNATLGNTTVTNGAVTAIAITDGGTYTTVPTVTIAPTAPGGAVEHARSVWIDRVNTWEGHQYVWHRDGALRHAGEAALPLLP